MKQSCCPGGPAAGAAGAFAAAEALLPGVATGCGGAAPSALAATGAFAGGGAGAYLPKAGAAGEVAETAAAGCGKVLPRIPPMIEAPAMPVRTAFARSLA